MLTPIDFYIVQHMFNALVCSMIIEIVASKYFDGQLSFIACCKLVGLSGILLYIITYYFVIILDLMIKSNRASIRMAAGKTVFLTMALFAFGNIDMIYGIWLITGVSSAFLIYGLLCAFRMNIDKRELRRLIIINTFMFVWEMAMMTMMTTVPNDHDLVNRYEYSNSIFWYNCVVFYMAQFVLIFKYSGVFDGVRLIHRVESKD